MALILLEADVVEDVLEEMNGLVQPVEGYQVHEQFQNLCSDLQAQGHALS